MHTFTATVWRWAARSDGWFFVTVPEDVSDDIEAQSAATSRGFGSVPVRVTVGSTTWDTSVFPDTARGAYVLPLKKAVRDREGLVEDGTADVTIELR